MRRSGRCSWRVVASSTMQGDVMKLAALLLSLAVGFLEGAAPQKQAGCDALGNVQFVCGLVGPEDLVVVPGEQWVIASGDAAPGAITLIHVKDRTTSPLYPSASLKQRLEAKTYDSCPAPIAPEEKDRFRAHGLFLRPGKNAVHTLYVVHHGNRESIEVVERDEIPVGFRLDNLRWAPDGSLLGAGQLIPGAGGVAMATSRVIKINPNTLKVQDLISYPY